ncbi:MAG: hypothetical protein JKY52_05340 [Flavobacteriales bacterium]|nr:hypothetical protein [Flavobacteriales bacterium]
MGNREPELDEEGFIAGVYNYCDRWCERCRFAMQCRVYDGISDENGNIKELTIEETLEEVSGSFKKTFEMLYDWAQEAGIDLDELSNDADEWKQERKLRTDQIDNHPLSKATWDYTRMTDTWLKEQLPTLDKKLNELRKHVELGIHPEQQLAQRDRIQDAIEVIQFYMNPIYVKTRRALDGLMDGNDYWDDTIQNDFNGSAKVALLETERSLIAFETLMNMIPEQLDDTLNIMAQLEKIRKGLLGQFPDARKFVRLGFDSGEA